MRFAFALLLAFRCAGEDVAPEEPTIESPKALTWRRNKLSDKERYEDDFYFEINGKRMVINQVRHTYALSPPLTGLQPDSPPPALQDVANELDTVGLTVWDSVRRPPCVCVCCVCSVCRVRCVRCAGALSTRVFTCVRCRVW